MITRYIFLAGIMLRFGWVMNSFAIGYRAQLTIDVRPLIKLP